MAHTKQKGLGRGFESLLPHNFDESVLFSKEDKIERIALDRLEPNVHQPRQQFSEEALADMAESIKQYGVLQPLIVVPHHEGKPGNYMIIAGERRWRASRLAGLETVPAIVRTLQDLERLEIALIENVQRVDLSALEQAESIEYLHRQFGTSYTDIARRLGKGNSTVVNIVRLLQLPDAAKECLRSSKITEGHARAILSLKDHPEKQVLLLENILKHRWTVRQAEQFVVSVRDGFHETKQTKQRMSAETPETKRLGKRLNATVAIRRTAKGGKLEVSFKTDEQLQEILRILG